jgi:hypothetical protein
VGLERERVDELVVGGDGVDVPRFAHICVTHVEIGQMWFSGVMW